MKKTDSENIINKGSIAIYKSKGGSARLEVKLENESVWLTQKQIADLFGTQRPAITKHLRNIFLNGELREKSVCSILEHTASDGKTYKINYYNLDAIISIGYRVNSGRATQFRIWATKVIKDHLVEGYTLNEKRLQDQTAKLQELQQAIGFIKDKVSSPELQGRSQALIGIIDEYAKSLTVLYEYDKGTLKTGEAKKPGYILTNEDSQNFIKQIKKHLAGKNEASDLFAIEIGHKFKSIIGALYQTYDGRELYASIVDKAAHLLYLTIKDHPFSDGNKRIGSMLFIYFLDKNKQLMKEAGEPKLNENALIAIALLVAESNPKEKDVMIKIIANLIE